MSYYVNWQAVAITRDAPHAKDGIFNGFFNFSNLTACLPTLFRLGGVGHGLRGKADGHGRRGQLLPLGQSARAHHHDDQPAATSAAVPSMWHQSCAQGAPSTASSRPAAQPSGEIPHLPRIPALPPSAIRAGLSKAPHRPPTCLARNNGISGALPRAVSPHSDNYSRWCCDKQDHSVAATRQLIPAPPLSLAARAVDGFTATSAGKFSIFESPAFDQVHIPPILNAGALQPPRTPFFSSLVSPQQHAVQLGVLSFRRAPDIP